MRQIVVAKTAEHFVEWCGVKGYNPNDFRYVATTAQLLGITPVNVELIELAGWESGKTSDFIEEVRNFKRRMQLLSEGPEMTVDTAAMQKMTPAVLSDGERKAIETVLELGERYGFGNLMAWMATGWAKRVPQMKGTTIPVTPYPDHWLKC